MEREREREREGGPPRDKKICPLADSVPPTPPKSVSSHGRILVFGGLATIFAELEFPELFNWQRFAAKRPSYASC
jgi:hypothetical protein